VDTTVVLLGNAPSDSQNAITIPWEFSKSPNCHDIFDTKRWWVIVIDKWTDNKGTDNKDNKQFDVWPSLKQILPFHKCIDNNIELEMAYRKSLVGVTIKIDDDRYQILNIYHHAHCWTIYIIQNTETMKTRQIQLQDYNEWSFGGIDKIEVEILKQLY